MSFGGSSSPPAPVIAAPPPPPEILDTIDELTGTETVTVVDPTTGKKKRVTRALPLSEEEKGWLNQAKSLMSTAVNEFNRLYSYGPQNVINFTPYMDFITKLSDEKSQDLQRLLPNRDMTDFVNSFKTARQATLDEEFELQRRRLENDLNRSGWENSTAANELKSSLASQQAKAKEQLDAEAIEYGQNLYDKDLARRGKEFSFREQGRMSLANDMNAKYLLEKEMRNAQEEQRQRAIAHQQMLYGIGEGITGAHTKKQLSTMAPKLALAENQLAANNQMEYYKSDVARQNINYQNELAAFHSQPPSFGQQLFTVGGQVAGAMAFGAPGTVAGQWGKQLFAPPSSTVPKNQAGVIRAA